MGERSDGDRDFPEPPHALLTAPEEAYRVPEVVRANDAEGSAPPSVRRPRRL